MRFKCSIEQSKQSFYRAANSIFAKVGRLASDEVVVQLLKHKCLPVLLYALEVCNLDKRSMQSLDFTVNKFFMKLFRTSNIEIVRYCQTLFNCDLPSVYPKKPQDTFTLLLFILGVTKCYTYKGSRYFFAMNFSNTKLLFTLSNDPQPDCKQKHQ